MVRSGRRTGARGDLRVRKRQPREASRPRFRGGPVSPGASRQGGGGRANGFSVGSACRTERMEAEMPGVVSAARRRVPVRKQRRAARTRPPFLRKAASLEGAAGQVRKAGGTAGCLEGQGARRSAADAGLSRGVLRRVGEAQPDACEDLRAQGSAMRPRGPCPARRKSACLRMAGRDSRRLPGKQDGRGRVGGRGAAEFLLAVLVHQPGQPQVQPLRRPATVVGAGVEIVPYPSVGIQPGQPLRGRGATYRVVGRDVNRKKMAKHFEVQVRDDDLRWSRRPGKIEAEARLGAEEARLVGTLLRVTRSVAQDHASVYSRSGRFSSELSEVNVKSTMSAELIGILSVGVALAGLILSVVLIGGSWVVDALDSLDARLDQVEQNQAVILERTRHLEPMEAQAR